MRPLFIMGSARSGTTWLANILSSHPSISAPACVEHHGIHESHLFDHTRYVFSDDLGCKKFISEYKKEDMFKLLSIDPETFCLSKSGQNDVFYWFQELMIEYAKKNNAVYWLEKTPKHLIYYDEIIKFFPNTTFVVITRGFRKTLVSNLTKYARADVAKFRQIIEKSFRYELDLRSAIRLCKQSNNVIAIKYEQLLENQDMQIKRILSFLSLEYVRIRSEYASDSSYKKNVKKYNMKLLDWCLAYVVRFITRIMPYSFACKLRKRRDMVTNYHFPLHARLSEK